MRSVLVAAAIGEMVTGVSLVLLPSLVVRLALGQPAEGLAVPLAQLAGFALIGLGIACWPGPAAAGLFAYSNLVAIGLAWTGLSGLAGPLLWPAVVVHVALSLLLWRGRKARGWTGRGAGP